MPGVVVAFSAWTAFLVALLVGWRRDPQAGLGGVDRVREGDAQVKTDEKLKRTE
jgi:hypothetical protein